MEQFTGSAGYVASKELMNTSVSLLRELMRSIPHGWLRIILRFICNSGAFLTPVYT